MILSTNFFFRENLKFKSIRRIFGPRRTPKTFKTQRNEKFRLENRRKTSFFSFAFRLIPKWLASVVPALVKAGKCAEILQFNRILFRLENEDKKHFFADFLEHLRRHLNLSCESWNPLVALGNSSRSITSKAFISFKLDFDDIDNEKNSFLALAFQRMQTAPANLLRVNR